MTQLKLKHIRKYQKTKTRIQTEIDVKSIYSALIFQILDALCSSNRKLSRSGISEMHFSLRNVSIGLSTANIRENA